MTTAFWFGLGGDGGASVGEVVAMVAGSGTDLIDERASPGSTSC